MLILTETDVEEGAVLTEKLRTLVQRQRFAHRGRPRSRSRSRSASPAAPGPTCAWTTLVRDADAAMYSAKSLGRNQTYVFAEPDDDARVPRAPISAAGRARAIEIGQQARDAATAALTSRPRAAAPLPRPAVGAHRLDRRGARPAAASCPRPRSIDCASRRCSTTSARSPCPRRSSRSRRRSRRPSGGRSSSTRASARSSSSRRPRSRTPCRSSSTTTSATPATAIRSGCAANEIPLGARIVAIADAYDAMIHDRPYKRAISHEQAIAELRRHAGTQFDPELVELFCDLYADHAPEPDATITALRRHRRCTPMGTRTPRVRSSSPSPAPVGSTVERRRTDPRPVPVEPSEPGVPTRTSRT